MNYSTALQSIDTLKALNFLELTPAQQGAYIHFPCPACQGKAVIKAYGDKKNLWYCPECKASGHIISLTMKLKGINYEEAKKLLEDKAFSNSAGKIEEELHLDYPLEYHDFLKNEGISSELCEAYGIGYCKKGIMNGHIALTVHDENGMKIAYVGINPKTRSLKIPKTFNPELYLYNYHRVNSDKEVYFTTNLLDCLRIIQKGNQSVCNFGLSYVSSEQFALLQNLEAISLFLEVDYIKEIAYQFATNSVNFHRFVKKI